MLPDYRIEETSDIITPALVVFREHMQENLRRMLAIAGSPARLRPHCKTHKMREPIREQLALGIEKHKAATFAEAEMLAETGVKDILLAYELVGANIPRAVAFVRRFPDIRFAVIADHPQPVAALGEAMQQAGASIDVLLDVDTGQHRTGMAVGPEAAALYRQIAETPGLKPAGLHIYDGHQHQPSFAERQRAVQREWEKVLAFREELERGGLPVPRLVAGGTGSFPVYAGMEAPGLELSPGTCIFHDAGYAEKFPDLEFVPAALLLTRVISRPTPDRLTLDLGYKAIASDPPAGRRALFPDLPDAREVLHNEEHLVLETAEARRFTPGDELLAIPRHICPTTALHRQVWVVSEGKLIDRWQVVARDRWLTI